MIRIRTFTAAAALPVVLLTTAAGCGSGTPGGSGGSTHVAIQGNPASPLKCSLVLQAHHPIARQLTASLIVTCNFPVATSTTRLAILGKPSGAPVSALQNVDDPKTSSETPPLMLTYTVNCITGIEYEAQASIDALGANGAPVNATESTTPRSYSASECSGS